MRLMTKALERRFARIGCQENDPDPIIVAKFFNPQGAGTWYATEYDPEERIIFGYVSIFGDHNDEWGTTALSELESYPGTVRSRDRTRPLLGRKALQSSRRTSRQVMTSHGPTPSILALAVDSSQAASSGEVRPVEVSRQLVGMVRTLKGGEPIWLTTQRQRRKDGCARFWAGPSGGR